MPWTPSDYVELMKAAAYTIGIVCIPLSTAYVMISAHRAKQNSEALKLVVSDVARLEKNTNSISERNQAIAQKLGITEGIAMERASVQANTPTGPAPLIGNSGPVPVADARTAAAVERVGEAIEKAVETKVTKSEEGK